jgi:hypothetical protein
MPDIDKPILLITAKQYLATGWPPNSSSAAGA